MNAQRLIKKYANRRMYDTVESGYVTLEDIRRFVLEGIDFRIVEKDSREDVTHRVLLDVVMEDEDCPEPLMSRDFLAQVIRAHNDPLEGEVGRHLEESWRLFLAQSPEKHQESFSGGQAQPPQAGF